MSVLQFNIESNLPVHFVPRKILLKLRCETSRLGGNPSSLLPQNQEKIVIITSVLA